MAPNDNISGDNNGDAAGEGATLFPAETGRDAGSDAGATPPAAKAPAAEKAPRRRATRRPPKKAAAAEAEQAPQQAVEQAELSGDGSTGAEAAGAAAPEAGAGDAVTVDVTLDAAAAADAPAAKRPARKRATRKKAADADETAPPAKATARRGSRANADRAAAALEELVAEVGTADQSGTPSGDAPGDGPAETPLDPGSLVDLEALEEAADEPVVAFGEAGTDDTDSTADDDRPAAVAPSFSVLFQAPDATKATPTRRRRAASAPEQTPPSAEDLEDLEEPEASDDERGPSDEQTDDETTPRRSRRRRGGKGRRGRASDEDESQDQSSDDDERGSRRPSADTGDGDEPDSDDSDDSGAESDSDTDDESGSSRRRRRRRRAGSSSDSGDDSPNVSTRVRQPRAQSDEPVAVKGSTRLEAKKQRRREGREAGRRRTIITEAEFLARREAVDRVMVVRNKDGRTQMGVLEDGVLVEHYIDQATNVSMAGNIYLGRVQNVLPSMEAAFVDIGKGRNAVLYAGEVNWDAAGLEANQPKRIENALSSGQTVLVQVTKDPIGHKGARLTSQISLPGRYLVYVPNSSMTGISRKLPDTERARLKKILREVVPDSAGVIVRTAAEGASEEELRADVERLTRTWEDIQAKAEAASTPRAGKSKGKKKNGGAGSVTGGQAPMLLHGEPDLTVRVIRDVFNEDFKQLVVAGDQAWNEIHPYISSVAPDLADRVTKWTSQEDLFTHHRVDEQLSKAMDRKVWLPSGGSLVIDRTEAMTVVDVNTGKFVGSGGNLEETVTKNNIEAAEEIVRQLRLRDIGGIIVIDFIDMVLESNRELVVRRLLECLGRDRTKHQVAEVTSLGLVQMTRKRVGSGLIEVFSETCDHCNGRGFIIHTDPVDRGAHQHDSGQGDGGSSRRRGRGANQGGNQGGTQGGGSSGGNQGGAGQGSGHGNGQGGGQQAPSQAESKPSGPTAAQIAAAAHAAALKSASGQPAGEAAAEAIAEAGMEVGAEVGAQGGARVPAETDGHPHAFPEDSGPWSGDDAHDDTSDDQATQGGSHVELESDVTDETVVDASQDGSRDAAEAPARTEVSVAASVESEGPTPVESAVDVQPAPRGRRRRGRVVAPAGPPRSSGGSETAGEG
ncbi:Rne/Rng family ribonuclease [Terrabacter terrigena]|uniref:Ribonuclease E/G n=1 Tax=Terrabacter terrigena TaxID=574718 RepID=A0ABW3N1D3_9MICO